MSRFIEYDFQTQNRVIIFWSNFGVEQSTYLRYVVGTVGTDRNFDWRQHHPGNGYAYHTFLCI